MYITIYRHFICTNNNAITNKLDIPYLYIHYILLIGICAIKFQIIAYFRGFKGWRSFEGCTLIRGVGAYSRGHLLDNPFFKVGAFGRGCFLKWVLILWGAKSSHYGNLSSK